MHRLIRIILIAALLIAHIPVWAEAEATQAIDVYTVKTGDTLWSIAQKFDTNVQTLQRLNSLHATVIYPRQELLLPQRKNIQQRDKKTFYAAKNDSYMAQFAKSELDWLARIISAEARGESLEGQIAVAAVVLNRAENPQFPNTIKGVIFQNAGGNYQFSPVADGTIFRRPVPSAYRAAEMAITGYDPTRGALFFYNPKLTSKKNWIRGRLIIKMIGNHAFAI
ncbi:MAG: cell wall hydrolase [Bacillota bacterium]